MLLISDANIFIDLDKIDLLEICTQLNYKIITTDFVYNELYSKQKETLDKKNIEM
jgi:rRNA-processing protein FCF1